MNLQFHLLSRIAAAALMCLLAASAYVLHRSSLQTRQAAQAAAESLGGQLEIQLLRIDAGFGQPRQFPDFSLWKQTASVPVMVTDLSLPGIGGLELINRVKQRCPDARILVFSMHRNPSFAVQASRAGALGYVTKSSAPDVLLRAIHEVHAGRRTLSPDIAQALALEKLGSERMALEALTVREFEILRLLAEGRPAETIAKVLNISPKTVRNSHYLIKRKLGAASDIELARLAIRLKVIDLPDLSGSGETGA